MLGYIDVHRTFKEVKGRLCRRNGTIDPAKPDANHVMRLEKNGIALFSYPAGQGDTHSAKFLETFYPHWANLDINFRFRLRKLPVTPTEPVAPLFDILWHINPTLQHPDARDFIHLELRQEQPNRIFVKGPYITWYGKDEPFDQALETGQISFALDTNWHTCRILSMEEVTTVYFDNQLFVQAQDDRILQGAIGFNTLWKAEVTPEALELDDFIVRIPKDEY